MTSLIAKDMKTYKKSVEINSKFESYVDVIKRPIVFYSFLDKLPTDIMGCVMKMFDTKEATKYKEIIKKNIVNIVEKKCPILYKNTKQPTRLLKLYDVVNEKKTDISLQLDRPEIYTQSLAKVSSSREKVYIKQKNIRKIPKKNSKKLEHKLTKSIRKKRLSSLRKDKNLKTNVSVEEEDYFTMITREILEMEEYYRELDEYYDDDPFTRIGMGYFD